MEHDTKTPTETAEEPTKTTELAKHEPQSNLALLRPVAAIPEILEAQEQTTEFIRKGLKPGVDYGTVPGTDKPGLFKAGAERLTLAFGVAIEYEIIEKEVDHDREVPWQKRKKQWLNRYQGDREFVWGTEKGSTLGLYRYVVKCTLKSRGTGATLGEAIGICSSLESKYIDRARDCENTIVKMAQKRALVGASLNVFGLSDRFTQDEEDKADDGELKALRPEDMDAPLAAKWMRNTLGLTHDDVTDIKATAAKGKVSWLNACRELYAQIGDTTTADDIKARIEAFVKAKSEPPAEKVEAEIVDDERDKARDRTIAKMQEMGWVTEPEEKLCQTLGAMKVGMWDSTANIAAEKWVLAYTYLLAIEKGTREEPAEVKDPYDIFANE